MRDKPTLTGQELIVLEADIGKNHELERLMHEKKIPYRICFGSFEGELSTSYIIHATQLKHILRSEHIAQQSWFLHVAPDGTCHLLPHATNEINSVEMPGVWKAVDEKTAWKAPGWTYDRETGQYFVVA